MSAEVPMLVKFLSENAVLPSRGSPDSAGFDLSSAHDTVVPARGQTLVKTDLSIAVPPGTYGRVAPRSGLALKNSIDVGAGVIDADYRGPVGVILFNFSDKDYPIAKGDRIAQLVLEKISMAPIQLVTELSATVRGEGGFGSTGKRARTEEEIAASASSSASSSSSSTDAEAAVLLSLSSLPLSSEAKSGLKRLLFERDSSMLAITQVFAQTGDESDLKQSLTLLAENRFPSA
eukprot:GILI01025941.1.p1 GENE.GILI01025941.1~~GILI01025941.1.p1  ORF type:complete len:233 (+),score=77.37 GILI01025941.1:111-809(+)